jgi:hypothetical protein
MRTTARSCSQLFLIMLQTCGSSTSGRTGFRTGGNIWGNSLSPNTADRALVRPTARSSIDPGPPFEDLRTSQNVL